MATAQEASPWCGYGINREILLLPEGFNHLESRHYYPWQDAERLIASRVAVEPPLHQEALLHRAQAYGAFLQWQLSVMVSGIEE